MENKVRTDIIRLFRSNPLMRDGKEALAARIGRSVVDVEKALQQLEVQGLVAARWVGGAPIYFYTGAPDTHQLEQGSAKTPAPQDPAQSSDEPDPAGAAVRPPAPAGDPSAASSVRSKVPAFTGRFRVPSTEAGVRQGRVAVEALCRALGMDAGPSMELTLAVSEAITNAHRYGRRRVEDDIRIDFSLVEDNVKVRIKDTGSGLPFVLVGASYGDSRSTGGRGLMLMRSLADSVTITRSQGGTTVELTKRLHSSAAPAVPDPGEPGKP